MPGFRQSGELMQVQALFLQRPQEAFDDAVALGLADIGRRDRHAEPPDFADPRVRRVLGAPVAPEGEPAGDLLREPAKRVADALAQRLRRTGIPKLLRCELSIGSARAEGGLTGSGLIVVNPPFPLERELRVLLPALVRWLAPTGSYRLDWLSRE